MAITFDTGALISLVDQRHHTPLDEIRRHDAEDSPNIFAPLAKAQAGLRRRGPGSEHGASLPTKGRPYAPFFQGPPQARGQRFGLIESSLPLTRNVQRHGNNNRRFAGRIFLHPIPPRRQQGSQLQAQPFAPLKLGQQNCSAKVTRIDPVRPRRVKPEFFAAAIRAGLDI